MITFRQKEFREYDAMRTLYVELQKRASGKDKFPIIDTSALIPILKGNNIVVERFVINTSMFGKDKFRMYIKIGAKAKLPDEVRLHGRPYDQRLINVRASLKGDNFKPKEFSEKRQSLFSDKRGPTFQSEISPAVGLSVERTRLLGDAVKYDKAARLLVLDFHTIEDAIYALNILPFGLNYKIYLLNS
jgi:hypothetical protein